ncbi:MAG: aspartate kinase [Candidatus Bathyarchaeota archaeon]|nr:aspartate kinase [Candidatus Bathyarchaeota archaeon]
MPNSNSSNDKERIIIKFGGASLADSGRILKATKFVLDEVNNGKDVVVVVSAMGKTTDSLLGILEKSSNNNLEKTDADDILSMGERTSIRIFTAALKSKSIDLRVKYFDPSDEDWPIITDENFTNANPIIEQCKTRIRQNIEPLFKNNIVPVIAGFVGKTRNGQISTIGRGGSDATAFIIAQALNAKEVVMVTDSHGIMSADPKFFPNAMRIPRIDVNYLVKLADSGAKFIHIKALKYKSPKTNVRVIHFKESSLAANGTIITGGIGSDLKVNFMSNSPIVMVTIVGQEISEKSNVINELIEKINYYAKLEGMSLNHDSAIFYVSENKDLKELLEGIHDSVKNHKETIAMNFHKKLGFLKISGVGLEQTPGVVGLISESLRLKGINIFGLLTITSSILVFIDWDESKNAKELIEKALEDSS